MIIDTQLIAITPVVCLEPGDVIARQFLGGVISGEVTGVAHYAYQLTDEQRDYMRKNDLSIPEGEYDLLDSPGRCLVFGHFWDYSPHFKTVAAHETTHMYVNNAVQVAVFPAAKISNDEDDKRRARIVAEESEIASHTQEHYGQRFADNGGI